MPAIVPPTVVMVTLDPDEETTPPAWKLVVVSAFVKVRETPPGLEMIAFEPMVGVAMLLNEMALVTESVPKTLSVVGEPTQCRERERRRDRDAESFPS